MPCDVNECLVKVGLRRMTLKNLVFFYYPLKGATCYVAFAGHVMNPLFLRSVPMLPRWLPVSSIAMANANLGLTAYLYNSRHLRSQHTCIKIAYSAFGSLMFNMGTILSMAMLRQLTPECPYVRTLVGAAASSALLYTGFRYVQLVDRQAVVQTAELADGGAPV